MLGDLDYIAGGGAQTLILRPVPVAIGPDTFTYVVQCYVYDIMDAEAVKGEGMSG